jgi:hypothetical protein
MVKTRAGSKPQPTSNNINSSSTRVQKVNIQSRKTIISQTNLNSQELKFTLTSSTLHSQKQGSYMQNNSQASKITLASSLHSRKQEPPSQPLSSKTVSLATNSRMHESSMQTISQASKPTSSTSLTGQTRMQGFRVQAISQASKSTSSTSSGQIRMQGSRVQASKPTSTTSSILLSRMQGSRMAITSTQSTAVAKPSVESGKNSGGIPDSVEKETIRLKEVEPIINQPFDFTTVRTEYQYKDPPKESRIMDITEAPTLYPTPEEFKDPYAYIESIADVGHRYGIVKIIPPEGWKPSFVLNTEVGFLNLRYIFYLFFFFNIMN